MSVERTSATKLKRRISRPGGEPQREESNDTRSLLDGAALVWMEGTIDRSSVIM
jgi:hypothetical protein